MAVRAHLDQIAAVGVRAVGGLAACRHALLGTERPRGHSTPGDLDGTYVSVCLGDVEG